MTDHISIAQPVEISAHGLLFFAPARLKRCNSGKIILVQVFDKGECLTQDAPAKFCLKDVEQSSAQAAVWKCSRSIELFLADFGTRAKNTLVCPEVVIIDKLNILNVHEYILLCLMHGVG